MMATSAERKLERVQRPTTEVWTTIPGLIHINAILAMGQQ